METLKAASKRVPGSLKSGKSIIPQRNKASIGSQPVEDNSRKNSMGEAGSLDSGRTVLPQRHRDSIGSLHVGGNSVRNSAGAPGSLDRGKSTPQSPKAARGLYPAGGSQRRNSTGKKSSRSNEDILPSYLRASTGSCHEFCKYGTKHAHEFQARSSIQKRTATTSSVGKASTTVILPERKRTSTTVKVKSPPVSARSPEPPEIIKREVPLPSKKVEVSAKQNFPPSSQNITKNEVKVPEKKGLSAMPKPVIVKPLSSGISIGSDGKKSCEIKVAQKTQTSKADGNKLSSNPTSSLSPKPSLVRTDSLKLRKTRILKLASLLKDEMPKIKRNKPDNVKVSEKIKIKSKQADGVKGLKKVAPIQAENIKVQEKIKSKQADNVKVQERTLHVIEAEMGTKNVQSIPAIIQASQSPSLHKQPKGAANANSHSLSSEEQDLDESQYSSSEEEVSMSETDETISTNGHETKKLSKRGANISEDKDEGVKLNFRRGKVVEIPTENSAPRKLRFRRGRVLGVSEDGQAYTRQKSFKKKADVDIGNKEESGLSPKNVVLKHQVVQEVRKDAQVSLNNVIEETASKLVETRKSKVKALVGAFETVISLQDGKPSVQSVT